MRRPSFQFYPGDWSSNPNLKRCTFAERGIWVEVMCLMHDQEEYGVLRWPMKEIAGAVGCKVSELLSLVRKGVMKGDDRTLDEPFVYVPRSGRKDGEPVTLIDTQDGPIWYSSRMVKDEYVRTIRGDAVAKGDTPKQTPKQTPKPPIGADFGPRGSSSSSSSSDKPYLVETHTHSQSPAGVCVSPVADCCKALVDAGIQAVSINQGHPKLLALVDAGATVIEFSETARECVGKGNSGFAYVLGTMTRRREQAAATQLHKGAMHRKPTPGQASADAAQRWLQSQTSEEVEHEAHG